MKCRKCKRLLPLEAKACPWCHTRVDEKPAEPRITFVNKSDQREPVEPKLVEPQGVLVKSAWYFKFEYLVICPKHSRFGIKSAVKLNEIYCPICGTLCVIDLVLRSS